MSILVGSMASDIRQLSVVLRTDQWKAPSTVEIVWLTPISRNMMITPRKNLALS